MFPAASPEAVAPGASQASRLDRIAVTVIVLFYAVLLVALTATHEPWRDEGQAWLWAKALSRPVDFFIIPGEGHPPIFYWLLRLLSQFLTFDQARWISPIFGMINAVLLAKLLRGDVMVLFAVLFTNLVLQFWGYYFRPYSLIFTMVLVSLLLERHGRSTIATWIMAITCGVHFLAGFLFGFWLIYRWHKGTPIARLLPPAVLGLAFGGMSLISGRGNPEGTPDFLAMPRRMLDVLAWSGWYFNMSAIVAVTGLVLLIACFWRDRFMMALLVGMTLLYAAASGLVYGRLPWHTGFLLMLALMALILSGPKARRWFFVALLAPQVVAGIAVVRNQLSDPKWVDEEVYQTVLDDAGTGFDPKTDLVVWPDLILSGTAARLGIEYVSANDGALVGPIDWASRSNKAVWPEFADRPTPYWLVCHDCARVLNVLWSKDQWATPLLSTDTATGDPRVSVYRVNAKE